MTIKPTSLQYYPQPQDLTTTYQQQSSSTVHLAKKFSTQIEDRTAKTVASIIPKQPVIKRPEPVVRQQQVSTSATITKHFEQQPSWLKKTTEEVTYYGSQQPEQQPALHSAKITRRLAPEMRKHEGQVARFEVHVAGSPEPDVYWYKDTILLKNTPDTRLTSESGVHTLVIPEIFPEDSGLYKCVTRNQIGSDESVCRLIIEGARFFFAFSFVCLFFSSCFLEFRSVFSYLIVTICIFSHTEARQRQYTDSTFTEHKSKA
jgi:Immunoglobulin I-set domain